MSNLSKLSITASLNSTGKKGGTPYTDAEKSTARQVLLGLLIATGNAPGDHAEVDSISEEVVVAISTAVEENEGNELGVPNLARRAYSKVQNAHFEGDDNEPIDAINWPKKRDYTSIGLIFRKQLNELKVLPASTVDEMFPSYWKSKGKKGKAS